MEHSRATAAGPGAAGIGRPVVAAHGVSKSFGATKALINAHIAVRPGEAHAPVGRNGAGKSTLVSTLTGLAKPDTGQVTFDDAPAPPLSDQARWQSKVACVYQKSTIIGSLSVAENLHLNRQGPGLRPISWRQPAARTAEVLAEYDIRADPTAPASTLAADQPQMPEIAPALSFGAKFIILDEPTAQLAGAKIPRLFERLRRLQESGVAFLFISHHLSEVYEICDRVTVYRDARHILTAPVAGLDKDELIEAMTGENRAARSGLAASTDLAGHTDRAPALRIRGLSVANAFAGLDVSVRAGEIVGLAGAGGSGAVTAGETVAGLHKPDSRTVEVARGGGRTGRGAAPAG